MDRDSNNNLDSFEDTELFKASETHLGGRGDMNSPKKESSKYVTRKFCNGVKVPVFIAESEQDEKNPNGWSWSHKEGLKSKKGVLDENHNESAESHGISLSQIVNPCTCPICWELMIEATASSCGHTFCASCLQEWLKLKPICPVCSKEVTCQIRLFSTDQFIELLLQTKNVPPELRRRYHQAVKARMEKQGKELSNKGVMKKIRERLDDLLISCKSKGVFGTLQNSIPVSKVRSGFSVPKPEISLRSWINERKAILLFGIIIGTLGTLAIFNLWNSSNFFRYVYLSLKNYDGSIPPHLLNGESSSLESGQNVIEILPSDSDGPSGQGPTESVPGYGSLFTGWLGLVRSYL